MSETEEKARTVEAHREPKPGDDIWYVKGIMKRMDPTNGMTRAYPDIVPAKIIHPCEDAQYSEQRWNIVSFHADGHPVQLQRQVKFSADRLPGTWHWPS